MKPAIYTRTCGCGFVASAVTLAAVVQAMAQHFAWREKVRREKPPFNVPRVAKPSVQSTGG